MADFLIRNRRHWMDDLTQEEIDGFIEKYPKTFQDKYNRREQRGDIIEVAEDGRWKDHQHGDGKFIIIHAPDIPVETAKKYMRSLIETSGIDEKNAPIETVKKKRKWQIDIETLPTNIKNKLNKDFAYTIPAGTFDVFKTNFIQEKI